MIVTKKSLASPHLPARIGASLALPTGLDGSGAGGHCWREAGAPPGVRLPSRRHDHEPVDSRGGGVGLRIQLRP